MNHVVIGFRQKFMEYLLYFPILMMLVQGCNSANFRGGKSVGPSEPVEPFPSISPEPVPEPSGIETFLYEFEIKEEAGMVDIVLAVDTSGSMTAEKESLERNMETFTNLLEEVVIDYQIFAIGNNFNFPSNLNLSLVARTVGSNNAIGVLNQFFANGSNLREGVDLHVVIISDDNGEGAGNLAVDFTPPSTAGSISVHGIVGLVQGQDPNNPDCQIVEVGSEHMDLARKYGGTILDLCINDWSQLVKDLSEKIISLTRTYDLERIPDLSLPVTVEINGDIIMKAENDRPGYLIDAETKKIRFTEDIMISPGSIVKISGVAPEK